LATQSWTNLRAPRFRDTTLTPFGESRNKARGVENLESAQLLPHIRDALHVRGVAKRCQAIHRVNGGQHIVVRDVIAADPTSPSGR